LLRDAECCATVTCLNYLTFSLDLSNPNISARRKAVEVGKCLYIVQPYIHEHWLDHLLAFAAKVTQARDRQLEACLEILLSICSHQYAWYLDPANKVQPDILAARNLEPRLRYLEHYGHHYKFLCIYVNYRHAKQVHFEMPNDYSKSSLEQNHQMANRCSSGDPLDPTPLSVVQLEYVKQVEFLLSADAVPGLTPEGLTMFRSTNRPYAFVCRFPGCSGMLAGFPTQDLRAQHEITHKPTLFCTHSECTYKLPFASQQSLGRHIRTFHNSVPRSAPKSIRRQRATRSDDRHDHVGTPNAPGDLGANALPNHKRVESTQSFNITGLPTFEPLFELDCEDDFTGLVNFPTDNNLFLGNKRQLPAVTRQGHADGMSPPEINIDFAPPSRQEHSQPRDEPSTINVPNHWTRTYSPLLMSTAILSPTELSPALPPYLK
jgi:hypothetical protein